MSGSIGVASAFVTEAVGPRRWTWIATAIAVLTVLVLVALVIATIAGAADPMAGT